MALEDLPEWTGRLRAEVARLLDGFEERHGYAPDENEVVERVARLDGSGLPPQVHQFFSAVDRVSLPDVWNGYFLGPAAEVHQRFLDGVLTHVAGSPAPHRVVAVGSDGGGTFFAVDVDAGGTVIRIADPAVRAGVVTGVVEALAGDLDAFLEALVLNVATAADGGTPSF